MPALADGQPPGSPSEFIGEFSGVSTHILALAKAMPADKYSWRPAPGVRSVAEVYTHIAGGNLMLLGIAGLRDPAPTVATIRKWEQTVVAKEKVLELLADSQKAVEATWAKMTPGALEKKVDFFGLSRSVGAIFLRILAHTNEHLGQAVAYARVNSIVPPWSQ